MTASDFPLKKSMTSCTTSPYACGVVRPAHGARHSPS